MPFAATWMDLEIIILNEVSQTKRNTIIQKVTCTPVFTAALFTIATSWKQPKCPSTDEWKIGRAHV